MNSDKLIELLFGYKLPVVFDVKRVESYQDFARLVDAYEDDGELVLVFQ